ncbi:unnamed protein product [Caenorhabditis angaria]|uniref:Transmembrane protein n=1 Tax=Caenorhabditis angaria TaxID=860376 RepID=A0A9P1ILJ7_9PELO|nr:unnamed protein product [Caenorhabditis angaria]
MNSAKIDGATVISHLMAQMIHSTVTFQKAKLSISTLRKRSINNSNYCSRFDLVVEQYQHFKVFDQQFNAIVQDLISLLININNSKWIQFFEQRSSRFDFAIEQYQQFKVDEQELISMLNDSCQFTKDIQQFGTSSSSSKLPKSHLLYLVVLCLFFSYFLLKSQKVENHPFSLQVIA